MDVLLNKKILLVSIISVIALSVSGFWLNTLSSNQLLASKYLNGLDTCYKRSFQSFTAKLVSDSSSPYLGNDFLAMTSTCFEELQTISAGSLKLILPALKVKTGKLIKIISNFNENLLDENESEVTPDNILVSNIGSHFEKIEKTKDFLEKIVSNYFQGKVEVMKYNKITFYSLIILAPIFLFILFFDYLQVIKRKSNFNEVALAYLNDKSIGHSEKESFFESFFEERDLQNVKLLFKSFLNVESSDLMESDNIRSNASQVNKMNDSLVHFADIAASENYKKQLDHSWQKEDQKLPADIQTKDNLIITANLSKAFLKAFDSLSPKLIDSNISIDFKVSKDVLIDVETEILEQVVCESLSFIINKVNTEYENSILLTSKSLGGTMLVEFKVKANSIDLIPSQTKIPVLNEFLNQFDSEYKIISLKNELTLQLMLKRKNMSKRTLAYVAKGTKSEILKSLRSPELGR